MKDIIFVYVKAIGCSACNTFDTKWNDIKTTIKRKYPYIVIEEIVNELGKPFDEKKYPKDLNRIIKAYPSFIVVDGKLWRAAHTNLTKSNPIVFNDKIKLLNYKENFQLEDNPSKRVNFLQAENHLKFIEDFINENKNVKSVSINENENTHSYPSSNNILRRKMINADNLINIVGKDFNL